VLRMVKGGWSPIVYRSSWLGSEGLGGWAKYLRSTLARNRLALLGGLDGMLLAVSARCKFAMASSEQPNG
jgi:hypothetical protein